MTIARKASRSVLAARSHRKIAERTAVLYARELDKLNSRKFLR